MVSGYQQGVAAKKLGRGIYYWVWFVTFVHRILSLENMSEEEKTEHDSAADGNQVVEEKPKKKTSKWEAVPIPTGGTINVQSNAPQSSYLNNDMNTASHAIKGKDKKENWQRIQRTTFTNWINNRLQGAPCILYTEI